ncbi:MAG: capsule assembly Wzi family protein, partial [Candidatus Deferrimicrobiaceae bacterium]
MTRFACTLAVLLSLLLVSPVPAADLFLTDEPEVYAAIEKLNALGYLPGLLANTRPYSLLAVRAATNTVPRVASPGGFEGELLRWVASYVAPKEMGRLTAAGAFSDARFTPANNEGIPTPNGWSGRAAVSARQETTPLVNGQIRYTYFRGEGGDDGNRLLDSSLEVGYRYFAVQAGKLSTWYGPGRHGALLFTNNAAPYPGVRMHNPEPIPMPGRFRFLGNVQYDFFAARTEKKALFSHSILVGTRLAARPAGWLELGFSRALHYGGEGRDDGISEFLTDYFGNNDPADRSNSLSGVDITLTLPFPFQPVQAYWER